MTMTITGVIYDIIKFKVGDYECMQIVVKRKSRGKFELAAYNFWGFWKEKADELDLSIKDKVRFNFRVKSRLFNNKYLTEAVGQEIVLLKKNKIKKVDINTGELFD